MPSIPSRAYKRLAVPAVVCINYNKNRHPPPPPCLSIPGSGTGGREVACSASDHQDWYFESCVWRVVLSHSSNHPQKVLLAQFSLYVHKGGLKPNSFHFICATINHYGLFFSILGQFLRFTDPTLNQYWADFSGWLSQYCTNIWSIPQDAHNYRFFINATGHSAIMALYRCGCLPCGFESRLGQNFQRHIVFLSSQSWDIVKMLCPWARHFTLKCFTWLRRKWVPGRTEMAMCTISSMRRNDWRTVCSPWSWNGTRMNMSSDQGVRCKVGG